LRLISLNVLNGGGERIPAQVEALCGYLPDLVALQEVFAMTVAKYRQAFEARGYPYAVDSFSLAPDLSVLSGPRKYGELLISRWPVERLPPRVDTIPWPERLLSAVVRTPDGECEVHAAHIPNGSNHSWLKIETLEGIYATLAHDSDRARILCGDFNLPQLELPDGTVITWGQRKTANGTYVRESEQNGRWDQGERNIIVGLAAFDLCDAYRLVNGYAQEDYSWYPYRASGEIFGRRFDHIFVSRQLEPIRCVYLHQFRQSVPRLSDHSAVMLETARDT
jgi:exonuclease III